MYYGTVQELVFHIDKQDSEGGSTGSGSITLFLLASSTFSSFLLAWMSTIIVRPILLRKNSSKNSNNVVKNSSLNHPLIVLTSITYLLAMAASNESLHYVSYPTCVLAKSSKLIPTMIVGWLVDRHHRRNHNNSNNNNNNISHHSKSINVMEWIGAILITVGILSFQYIQLQKQQTTTTNHGTVKDEGDSPYGLALLGLSLCMDGLMAACQNSLKRGSSSNSNRQNNSISSELVTSSYQRQQRRPPSAMETMLYINLYATLILLPLSYYAGQFQRGIDAMISTRSCSTSGSSKSNLLLQLNLSASLGQVFIFLTVHHFSPLTCTTITTTRKFFTILLSVYKFGHVLSVWQWCSVTLVFAGLYMEIGAKLFEGVNDNNTTVTTMKKKTD